MLRQRIITALVLAVLAVWGVYRLPPTLFSVVIAGIVLLAAWEWSRLAHLDRPAHRAFYVLAVAVAITGVAAVGADAVFAVLGAALLWWFAALVWVLRFPAGSRVWRTGWPAPALAGLLVMVPAWAAIATVHRSFDPSYLLTLLLLVWGADIGAYFAGRRWGRHKLAPRVSPGKTREGLGGALLVAALVTAVATWYFQPSPWFLLVCLAAVLASVLGDLVESMFKRLEDVKDSSQLLPGHGGVLDRVDSVTAAAPVYAAGLLLLGGGA